MDNFMIFFIEIKLFIWKAIIKSEMVSFLLFWGVGVGINVLSFMKHAGDSK